jgi:DUF2075 family protein
MPAFYANYVKDFLSDTEQKIIGELVLGQRRAGFKADILQIDAWKSEINILKKTFNELVLELATLNCGILLEYPIPRRSKRIDAVITAPGLIFVLEFKVGSYDYKNHDKLQVEDYCLDLRDFHKESSDKCIVPILISTKAPAYKNSKSDVVVGFNDTILANAETLKGLLSELMRNHAMASVIDMHRWDNSQYSPTPTIIEAAVYLYATHGVKDIVRTDSGHENLTKTSDTVIEIIRAAESGNKKVICFVTGVPGSGKTLAGLNIVHNFALHNNADLGVFLSGNGPLVDVLQEALALDYKERTKTPMHSARRTTRTFIQDVHVFLDQCYTKDGPIEPREHVIIFDEAQRAWDARQSNNKFQRDLSEPELLLSIADKRKDWCVIVALIGGGQEINTGEGGLKEWGDALANKFPNWEVHISPELSIAHPNTIGDALFESAPDNLRIMDDINLHLAVSIRSYRTEMLSQWSTELLNDNSEKARRILQTNMKDYPIKLTRDLATAKMWLKSMSRGLRRCGLMASSEARRLRPYGVFVDMYVDATKWFLGDESDIRSSSFLELIGKEYLVQGLELDWAGVCWDADFRRALVGWDFYKFRGSRWQKIHNEKRKRYLLNKYRVLLTRAREGMIIWVPKGDAGDQTSNPEFYNSIAAYLKECGIEEI